MDSLLYMKEIVKDVYVVKPFDMDALDSKIKHALEIARKRSTGN